MKKSILFSILAIAFAVGLSSCNKEKSYSCSIKIETERRMEQDSIYQKAVEEEMYNLISVFDDEFKANEHHKFTIMAKDESDLLNQVKKLCENAEKKVTIGDWKASHTIKVFWCKDEKNYSPIFTTNLGLESQSGIYQGGCTTYNLKEVYTTYIIPMWRDFTPSEAFYIQGFTTCDGVDLAIRQGYDYSIRLDLNDGAGGEYIYLYAYYTYWFDPVPVTDMIILHSYGYHDVDFTYTYQGRVYHMAKHCGSVDGDLNDGAGGDYYFLMYTSDENDGWKLKNMKAYEYGMPREKQYATEYCQYNGRDAKWEYVSLVDESTGERLDVVANCNEQVGGHLIYLDGFYVK